MAAIARRSIVGVLLALCIGVQLLEVSGRWDQTFQDANDEAGIVAIVLCVGVAIAVARTLLARVRFTRSAVQVLDLQPSGVFGGSQLPLILPLLPGSPPTALRI